MIRNRSVGVELSSYTARYVLPLGSILSREPWLTFFQKRALNTIKFADEMAVDYCKENPPRSGASFMVLCDTRLPENHP